MEVVLETEAFEFIDRRLSCTAICFGCDSEIVGGAF